MFNEVWTATAVGVFGGLWLSFAAGRAFLPRLVFGCEDSLLAVRFALAGTIVAFVPALLLAFVAGATLGGASGAYLTQKLGFGSTGAPLGVALGIALVLAFVLLSGALAGVCVAKAITYTRAARSRAGPDGNLH